MRASRLLILASISIMEFALAEYPVNRQAHLQSRPSRYPKSSALLDKENSRDSHLHDLSDDLGERRISYRRNRHKKNHRWSDPIRYKKPRGPKRLRGRRKPKRHHSVGKRPGKVYPKNHRYSDVPSTRLQPPKSLKSTYDLYTPRDVPLADQPNNLDPTPATYPPKNHRLRAESEEEDIEENERPTYMRDHAPEHQLDTADDIETNDSGEKRSEKSKSPNEESQRDRINFHIQGHEGPETYIFGFDTGVGNNRQFRLEERHEDGSVTGHYGYVDARGKLRKVRYKASPTQGYVEKTGESTEQQKV